MRRSSIARSVPILGVLAILFATGWQPAPGAEPAGIVEIPVAFQVRNVDETALPCMPDGKTYTVRGSLMGPASLLGRRDQGAVTLYIHGSGNGSFWHFTAVPGYDYASDMARLGHASVVLDTLGYGTSDIPPGTALCFGSVATTVRQVIARLRSGEYEAGPHEPVRFGRVALAGHSGGGIVVESVAVSFPGAIDAVILADKADSPHDELRAPVARRAITGTGPTCATGGEKKRPGSSGGYAFVFTPHDWRSPRTGLFHNADPAVVERFISLYERDFCGLLNDVGETVVTDLVLTTGVSVPVLLVYGDRTPVLTGSPELQRQKYESRGNRDVSLAMIPDSGHMLTLQHTAGTFRSVMHGWLQQRGF